MRSSYSPEIDQRKSFFKVRLHRLKWFPHDPIAIICLVDQVSGSNIGVKILEILAIEWESV